MEDFENRVSTQLNYKDEAFQQQEINQCLQNPGWEINHILQDMAYANNMVPLVDLKLAGG